MVLSGEGADEIFGGYLYFHKAPSARAFHQETLRKLSKLYLYDCLRANKSLAAWGVEGRVPFLDREFLDVAMRLNPEAKMCPGTTIAVSDEEMAHAAERFPIHTPQNKEEYYYRTIFEEHFPSNSAALSVPSVPSVACSTAEALEWDASFKDCNDPSGRAVKGVHVHGY